MMKHGLFVVLLAAVAQPAGGWSDHPLLAKPALSGLEHWEKIDSIQVQELSTFLAETEVALAAFLRKHEQWARNHLPHYRSRPQKLEFQAGGETDNIIERFLKAIRLHPGSKVPLYLYAFPGEHFPGRTSITPAEVSTLGRNEIKNSPYVSLKEGEAVAPLDVLVTANNEPDYGFDLGLFEDNSTPHGKIYNFGNQPFGNPNLVNSSQAPFHMGFYHEAHIVWLFGPFLKQTYLDYRIHLFRELSVFAFTHNQPYWGWRFLGWSMHYAGDITMPYHSKPLPGYSSLQMIWINLKAMLGFPKSRDHAIQLVSNRHVAMEAYQRQELRRAYLENDVNHPFFVALKNPPPALPYSDNYLKSHASARAAKKSRHADRMLRRHMPARFVNDPLVEASDLPGLSRIARLIREEKGERAVDGLNVMIAERLCDYSMTLRGLLHSVMEEACVY